MALFLKHIIEAELILKLYKKRHTSDESKTLSWNKRQYIAPNLLQWFKKKKQKKKQQMCVLRLNGFPKTNTTTTPPDPHHLKTTNCL